MTNGLDNFTGKKEFPREITSKYHWGASDTVLFDRSAKEIKKLKEPFFAEILTISNHSPFEIPKEYESRGVQVDVLPTIMGYLGGSYKNASWGKDLLNAKDGERMAYTKSPK